MEETVPSAGRPTPKIREAATALGERAHASIDRLSTGAHHTVDRAAAAATGVADQLDTKREAWSAASDEWMQATRGYVREHPVAALCVALAAGNLVSRLLARG
jgi:ElaB/YqjD/DUF883 family membrane-anchored ribosome-binding protein